MKSEDLQNLGLLSAIVTIVLAIIFYQKLFQIVGLLKDQNKILRSAHNIPEDAPTEEKPHKSVLDE